MPTHDIIYNRTAERVDRLTQVLAEGYCCNLTLPQHRLRLQQCPLRLQQ